MNIRLMAALLALPLSIFSHGVLAQAFPGSFGNCSPSEASIPVAHFDITSSAGAGQPLGDTWIPMGVLTWNCRLERPQWQPEVGVDFVSGSRIDRVVTVDSQRYSVIPTSNKDVGIIYQANILYSQIDQKFGLPYYVSILSNWNPIGDRHSLSSFTAGSNISVALIPTARLIQLNDVIIDDHVVIEPLYAALRRVDSRGEETGIAPVSFNFPPIDMKVAASCDVSIPAVTMPRLALGNFHGISDTPVTTQPFNVTLTDCTAGLSSLGYTITTNNSTNAARTIARVDASSQASGIGLGLLTREGSPTKIVFDQENPVTSYNSSSPTVTTVPMLAALYQMDATVTPGEYQGTFNFKLVYK